jgi:hypothetical protein
LIDALEQCPFSAIQRGENLVAPGVNESSDVGRRAAVLFCYGFEAGDCGDGAAVDLAPSLHGGEADAYPRKGARTGGDGVQVDVS